MVDEAGDGANGHFASQLASFRRIMNNERLIHLKRFYSILDRLEQNIGGAKTLADCSGRMVWPRRGVYFFREAGEVRSDSSEGPRIVRVGTHALKTGAGTKLWSRLSTHKGQRNGGGNHRGSFRLILGTALIHRWFIWPIVLRVPTAGESFPPLLF